MTHSFIHDLTLVLILLPLLLQTPSTATATPEPPAPRPNFIILLTDDQEYESIAHMPILQAELVAKGMTFTQACNTSPLCCPSRTTLLRGHAGRLAASAR